MLQMKVLGDFMGKKKNKKKCLCQCSRFVAGYTDSKKINQSINKYNNQY